MEKFDKDYFYGRKKSNYPNYEKINPSIKFETATSFIKKEGISGRFLEVGCAFGFLLSEMAPFFDELYGCDISPFAIDKAKERNPTVDLRVVDIEESLPYPDTFFDCIAAMDVLEHTESFEDNLSKLVSKLKRGGYLIVSSPLDAWPRRLFSVLDRDDTHISIPKESRLKEMINELDLIIVCEKKYAPSPLRKIPYIPAQIELILRKD
jgi:SAM-dependent methyltransferase